MLASRHLTAAAVVLAAALVTPGTGAAADRSATPATFASVVEAAQGGDVIHLSAGDYGRFTGATKASMVTLKADPGVTASIATDLNGASNLRFQNLRITSASIERSASIQYAGNTFTGSVLVDTTDRDGDHAILFDANTHDGVTVCSSCYEGRITVHGSAINRTPVGVTIRRSHFGGGGNSDGIQVGAYGVQILDNEFADLRQGDPSLAHTDAIQLYGQSHTVIRGNYIHDVATGILCADGCDGELIEHNVIVTSDGYPGVLLGPDHSSTVRHNTLPSSPIRVDGGNGPGSSSGTTIQDNIVGSYALEGSALKTDFNLVAGGGRRAPSDLQARPIFVGGAHPTSFAGFALAAGSPGKGSASDGTDRGVNVAVRSGAPGPDGSAATGGASKVRISVARRMSWYRLRRGVRVRVGSAQDVTLRLTLVPRGARRALARRRVAVAAGTRVVVVRPTRSALGARRSRTLRLRATIVDAGGAVSDRRFTIRVRA
jgi:hypothetical protein